MTKNLTTIWKIYKRRFHIGLATLIILSLISSTNPSIIGLFPNVAQADEPSDLSDRVMKLRQELKSNPLYSSTTTNSDHVAASPADGSERDVIDIDLLPIPPDVSSSKIQNQSEASFSGTIEPQEASFCPDPSSNRHGTYPTCPGSSLTPDYLDLSNFVAGGRFSNYELGDLDGSSSSSSGFPPGSYGANLLDRVDRTLNYHTSGGFTNNLMTLTRGGNGSQFLGATDYPSGFGTSFPGVDPLFSGIGSSSLGLPLDVQAVLGYDASSPYNFTTQFLTNLNNLLYPWLLADLFVEILFDLDIQAVQPVANNLTTYYQTVADRQLEMYYNDRELENLRIQWNYRLSSNLYSDPVYVYLEVELNDFLEQIRTTRPSYTLLMSLAQEMASWDNVPNDPQILADRYQKRLLLKQYQAAVEQETQEYLQNTPEDLTWITQTQSSLSQIRQQKLNDPEFVLWYAAWLLLWQEAYEASSYYGDVTQQIDQMYADYPAFEEYQQLNQETVGLVAEFNAFPPVQGIDEELGILLQNPGVTQKIDQYYNQYTTQVGNILGQTQADVEIERYYEQLNALVYNDPDYVSLNQLAILIDQNSQNFKRNIHDAVGACYIVYGSACDPYNNPVILLLYEQTDQNGNNLFEALMNDTAQFYELNNAYWYNFYTNNPAYQTLENDTRTNLAITMPQIWNDLLAARNQFQTDVSNIPEIRNLYDNMIEVVALMRSDSAQWPGNEAATEVSALANELDWRLIRMRELSLELRGITLRQTYLPILLNN